MLIAIQACRMDEENRNNVRLYICREDKDIAEGLPLLGTKQTFEIGHPSDIGLNYWNAYWADDCGYLPDAELMVFALEVSRRQGQG